MIISLNRQPYADRDRLAVAHEARQVQVPDHRGDLVNLGYRGTAAFRNQVGQAHPRAHWVLARGRRLAKHRRRMAVRRADDQVRPHEPVVPSEAFFDGLLGLAEREARDLNITGQWNVELTHGIDN
jgi:hypothetical protein